MKPVKNKRQTNRDKD